MQDYVPLLLNQQCLSGSAWTGVQISTEWPNLPLFEVSNDCCVICVLLGLVLLNTEAVGSSVLYLAQAIGLPDNAVSALAIPERTDRSHHGIQRGMLFPVFFS